MRVVPKANAFAEWSTAARQFCFSAVFFRTCSHLKVDKTRKPTLATERSSDGLTFDYDLRTRETDCYVACKFAAQQKKTRWLTIFMIMMRNFLFFSDDRAT